MRPLRIYFGHALTNAPAYYVREREWARQRLDKVPGWETLRFLGKRKAARGEVYKTDIVGCVGKCDLFVCDLTIDTNGGSVEFANAIAKEKPTLVLHRNGVKLSRVITDHEVIFPDLVTVRSYQSITRDICRLVSEKIAESKQLYWWESPTGITRVAAIA